MRLIPVTVVVGVLLVAVACGSDGSHGGSARLEAISASVEPFRQAFNDSTGHARLVLLLSPT